MIVLVVAAFDTVSVGRLFYVRRVEGRRVLVLQDIKVVRIRVVL